MANLYTRQRLISAFNQLILKTELENITVAMIADKAEVGKATFYRYFKDKYDIMNSNYKHTLDMFLDSCSNYQELYCELFRFAQEKIRPLYRTFNSSGINSLENFIFEYSKSVVERITQENRNGAGFTEQEQLQIDVFCHGISYMYKKWTLGKYRLTPEDAAEALYRMMPETLKSYWVKRPAQEAVTAIFRRNIR